VRYVVFDVETPNSRNDRMSAIGVVVMEDTETVREFYTLVNPETHFDSFNVALTKITPFMVRRSPTFPVLWQLLEPLMSTGILVAHNAPFDMGVLAKCLRDYGIEWKPRAEYACTVRMGRRLMPELPDHKLDTMAGALKLPLDHHNALSDTRACAGLLRHYLEMGASVESFVRTYDLSAMRTVWPESC
jgi:DNA polymerase-3 subunit epsilon